MLLILGAAAAWWGLRPHEPPTGTLGPTASSGTPPSDGAFAASVAAIIRGEASGVAPPEIPYLPADAGGLAYVAVRIGGERGADAWGEGSSPADALAAALSEASEELDEDERVAADAVEIAIAGPEADAGTGSHAPGDNLDRGILGLALHLDDGRILRYAPSLMIAANTSFPRVIERLQEDGEIGPEGVAPEDVRLFEATQLLVDVDNSTVTPFVRGNQVVAASGVTAQGTEDLAAGMATWLTTQLQDDGRMVYEYFPSRGEESRSNNMIRQWMATIALQRIAAQRRDAALDRRIEENIAYNLGLSYRVEDRLGLIADPDGDVKLGAVALAALAISQSPARESFAAHEAALRRMVDHLWQPDGSFETFYVPAGRRDNQNFYPGEALLLWASTLEDDPDPVLLDRFMRSFEYYRTWHREQRNPAFVPWHTMAYEKVWAITGDRALADFVFEMNDWLLEMQQWADAPAPDVAGRFYNPDHPEYGPPHASSDGVYLEGLVAAYRLAQAVGDDARADAYRTAISRGIRHLKQLQFVDDVDMYYVSQRDRVAGGLRTTVYDNVIRVDNVQHGLLAVLDVLEAFGPDDYRISAP